MQGVEEAEAVEWQDCVDCLAILYLISSPHKACVVIANLIFNIQCPKTTLSYGGSVAAAEQNEIFYEQPYTEPIAIIDGGPIG
jgi:hypothetical protein